MSPSELIQGMMTDYLSYYPHHDVHFVFFAFRQASAGTFIPVSIMSHFLPLANLSLIWLQEKWFCVFLPDSGPVSEKGAIDVCIIGCRPTHHDQWDPHYRLYLGTKYPEWK